jgi:hypothetical protein
MSIDNVTIHQGYELQNGTNTLAHDVTRLINALTSVDSDVFLRPLASSSTYVGTTAIALNRASAAQALTGITSIDGSAATLTTSRTLWGQSFNGSANVTGNLTSVGNITGSGAISLTTAAASDLSLTSGTTGVVSLDSGTTGAINIGTGANTKTITIGSSTGTVQLPTAVTKVGQTSLIQGGVVNVTFPTLAGTLVGSGDTGTVTSTMILDGTILNADVNASAAIAGTKISPDFGSQNVTTTGTSTAASFIPSSATVPTNGLYLSAANTVALSTASTGRVFIDSSGKLGIGVSSPSAQLHMVGAYAKFTDGTYDGYFGKGSSIVTSGGTADVGIASATATGAILFATNTSVLERMRITAGGNVGIGVTAPAARLHSVAATTYPAIHLATPDSGLARLVHFVGGNNYSYGVAGVVAGNGTATGDIFGLGSSSNGSGSWSPTLSWTTSNNANNPGKVLVGTTTAPVGAAVQMVIDNSNGGGIEFATNNNGGGAVVPATGGGLSFLTFTGAVGSETYSTRLAITSAGTVNIVGAGTAGSTQAVSFNGSAPVNSLVLDSTGKLGIGTSSPGAKLEVLSSTVGDGAKISAPSAIFRINASNNADSNLVLSRNGTDKWLIGNYNGSADQLGFYDYTASAYRLVINTNGNVGIGVTSTSYQLQLSTDSAGKPSTALWTITSDERIKEDIELADLDLCYEAVKTIPLKRYKWRDEVYSEEQVTDRRKLGWIAQDVETVFPKAVSIHEFKYNQIFEEIVIPAVEEEVDDEGNIITAAQPERTERGELISEDVIEDCKDLNADQIYAAMYGAIQKLIAKVEALETEVTQLKV